MLLKSVCLVDVMLAYPPVGCACVDWRRRRKYDTVAGFGGGIGRKNASMGCFSDMFEIICVVR